MTPTPETSALFSTADVECLNAARRTLAMIGDRVRYTSDTGETRLFVKCEDALDAIFAVLSTARFYVDGNLATAAELHDWREASS